MAMLEFKENLTTHNLYNIYGSIIRNSYKQYTSHRSKMLDCINDDMYIQ